MVRLRSAATLLTVVVFALTARAATPPGAQSWPPQLQLQMQVPFEPSAFPSAGRTYLIYELYLSNFESRPVTIDRVDVLNADDSKPIATFEAQQLNTILHHMGTPVLWTAKASPTSLISILSGHRTHGEPERRKRQLPLNGTLVDFRMSH